MLRIFGSIFFVHFFQILDDYYGRFNQLAIFDAPGLLPNLVHFFQILDDYYGRFNRTCNMVSTRLALAYGADAVEVDAGAGVWVGASLTLSLKPNRFQTYTL